MVDFKFDDVADLTTNNYKYTHYPISQELKAQPDNNISPVNRV